ncbi:hypothetical protein RJ641_019437 [Dillenia turbinata]|uniref:Uncharacterized protein n=1 Tax=Dillenia turbinata TaxID=194707 RepID=A0AAN8YXD1_9MAGN
MASRNLQLFSLLLVALLFIAHVNGQDPGSDCDFVGQCKTNADCDKQCLDKEHKPTPGICVPNPNLKGLTCCCIIA